MTNIINLKELGKEAFDYFPQALVQQQIANTSLEQEYQEHISNLHTDQLWDISKIESGMIVQDRHSCEIGTVTEYHTTAVGQLNGGIEVVFDDNHSQVYYPHQLRLIKRPQIS